AGHPLRRPAAARVEKVAELPAVVFQVLKSGRRRPQGPVAQPHHSEPPGRVPRVAEADPPAVRPSRLRPYSVHATVAAVQQASRHIPVLAQQPRRPVQGITLADAAQVDLQPVAEITDGALLRIEDNVAHANASQDGAAFRFGGNAPRPAVKAPRLDEGTRA